jgi:anaerobic ribonucleoside-triphosphate reductase
MDLLPSVFRTEGDVVKFEPSKIMNSIIKETGIEEEDARKITELTVRRIISSGIKFLSGPHIREIVCSILSESHHEQERKLYTRIGMPLMDYEDILERGSIEISETMINPEKIHHLAANRLAEEYSLLRILSDQESQAHLYGDLYIHQLKYFDLRPYSQKWDPRIIMDNGLPPIENWKHTSKSGPPKTFRQALDQLASWLGMIQTECSGNQALDYFTIFLSPYIRNLEDKSIKSELSSFIYKLNYLSSSLGKSIFKTSINCHPFIISPFKNAKVAGVHNVNYAEYTEECFRLFSLLAEVYSLGDYNKNAFIFPQHNIFCEKSFISDHPDIFSKIVYEIISHQNPHLCFKPELHLQSEMDLSTYLNEGLLQKISLNLPRYAFLSNDETRFIEILNENLELSFKILKKKYNIINQRLQTKHLPICSGIIKTQPLFQLQNQKLCVTHVGLNEATKLITGEELHESTNAIEFGRKILIHIKTSCENASEQSKMHFSLMEGSSNKAIERFIRLDRKHFPPIKLSTYSNGSQFSINAKLGLLDKLELRSFYHDILANDLTEFISIKNLESNFQDLRQLSDKVEYLCKSAQITCLKFLP